MVSSTRQGKASVSIVIKGARVVPTDQGLDLDQGSDRCMTLRLLDAVFFHIGDSEEPASQTTRSKRRLAHEPWQQHSQRASEETVSLQPQGPPEPQHSSRERPGQSPLQHRWWSVQRHRWHSLRPPARHRGPEVRDKPTERQDIRRKSKARCAARRAELLKEERFRHVGARLKP